MSTPFSRRRIMQGAATAALAPSLPAVHAAPPARKWPIEEGPDTPKLCLSPGDGGRALPPSTQPAPPPPGAEQQRGRFGGGFGGYLAPQTPATPPASDPQAILAASYRRIRQIGVTHLMGVSAGGPGGWTVESVSRAVQNAKEHGLVAWNSMIGLPSSILYGQDSRSKDMERVLASIEAAGKGGLKVVEYNFYAHRAIEGYYETIGRAGAGYTAFDNELVLLIDENNIPVQPVFRDPSGKITPESLAAFPNARQVKFKDLPPLPNEGARSLKEMWANITWFLKIAVPAAEKAGVLLALHPNDPPTAVSRGSQQIMGTLAGWKHLIEIVNSPANGITYDCGVTTELGEDAVAVAEYFASRQRINHVHYRNVLVEKPYERYQEVFVDNGTANMFGVMQALVKHKYTGIIYPEHPRALDADRDRGRIGGYPGGGGYTGITYSVAYTRAMLQAALQSL